MCKGACTNRGDKEGDRDSLLRFRHGCFADSSKEILCGEVGIADGHFRDVLGLLVWVKECGS